MRAPHSTATPGLANSLALGESLSVTAASDADGAAWNLYIRHHPEATGCHAWEWRSIIARAFGHESIYLMARRGETVWGVLPLVQINSALFGRTLTSMPFLNYGGIVADDDAAADALLAEAARLGAQRRCAHVELRHAARRFSRLPCKQHKVTMLLRLGTVSWETLDRKVRNQIRKAQKSGLTIDVGGLELVRDFYAVFARNMRDLGTPVYARRFFEEVLRALPDRAHIHIVHLDGVPVAAALTYQTCGVLEVPWASSVRDYNSLCPNHHLYWHLLEFAIARSCEVFDFGRSTPGEGTFKFKEQWGAEPVPLHWEYPWLRDSTLPGVHTSNPRFALAIAAWKLLPVAVATAIGPRLVRGIP